MAKTFKNGVSFHHLLETAPLEALQPFLVSVDEGRYAALFGAVSCSDALDDAAAQAIRRQLFDLADTLNAETAASLERHAQRILTLAEGRGAETLHRVAARLFDQEARDAFAAQRDALGRSLWLYLYQPQRFDEAESLYYVPGSRVGQRAERGCFPAYHGIGC